MRSICESCHKCTSGQEHCAIVEYYDEGYEQALIAVEKRLLEMQGEYLDLKAINELITDLQTQQV